jgi:transcriptional antiterminator RfaH
MPILAREPDLFPSDLFDRPLGNHENDKHWWVLYTRSRCEKELMRRLRGLEIPHYGPLIEKRNRSGDGRIRASYIPLFANYVFLYGDAGQRLQALTTNCVSRDLIVSDPQQLVDDLRQFHKLIESGLPITPESQLEPGTRVRVKSGPLSGQEGVIVQRRGEKHLLVAVRFLQQGATVQIDDCQVEKLD